MLTPDEAERLAAELWSRNNTAGDWAALLLRVAASARETERERAIKDVCSRCEYGLQPTRGYAGGYWHKDPSEVYGMLCGADAIRRRAAGEGGGVEASR